MSTPVAYCLTHSRAHVEESVDDSLACKFEDWPVVNGKVIDSVTVEEEPDPFFVLGRQSLAYLRTGTGDLVPVKVLVVTPDGGARVKVTAAREGWLHGETLSLLNPTICLLHREQVSVRKGERRISGAVRVLTNEGKLLP